MNDAMVLIGCCIGSIIVTIIMICMTHYIAYISPSLDMKTILNIRIFRCFFLVCCAGILGAIYIFVICSKNPVDALDVYRGKCELEVTQKIVDGVVVSCDSVVVYK